MQFMKNFFILLTIIVCFCTDSLLARDMCSRIAIINHQEVIIDTGPRFKGEGLRYYLSKDEQSLELLNKYQENQRPSSSLSFLSTTGSIFIIGGLAQTDNNNSSTLITTGLFLSIVSILFTKTMLYDNEKLLKKSVDQYNRSNYPKIYFAPALDNYNQPSSIGLQMEF
jgi:hypothetical protein